MTERHSHADTERFAEELRACEAANTAGDFATAVAIAQRIRAAAAPAGRALEAGRAVPFLVDSLLRLGEVDRAIAVSRSCLPEIDGLDLEAASIRVRGTLARAFTQIGEPVAALTPATEALVRARALGDAGLMAWGLNGLATAYEALGQRQRAIALLRQACESSERSDDVRSRFMVRVNLAATLARAARRTAFPDDEHPDAEHLPALREALQAVRKAAELVSQQPYRLLVCREVECVVLHGLRALTDMRTAMDQHRVLAIRLGVPEARAESHILEAEWLLAQDRVHDACEVLDHKIDPTAALRNHGSRRWWWSTCHRVYRAAGRAHDALRALESLVAQERRDFQNRIDSQTGALLREVEVQAALQQADSMRQRAEDATQAALQDALTGLPNRRALDARLAVELQRADRCDRALVAAMVDIDHFKQVNDAHGHDVGDAVLRRVGGLLAAGLSVRHFVARNGGDEFFLLFIGLSLADAALLCESLRAGVQADEWARLTPGHRLTVSIGLTAVLPDDDPTSLMRRADRALYQAKHLGRNQLACVGQAASGGAPLPPAHT